MYNIHDINRNEKKIYKENARKVYAVIVVEIISKKFKAITIQSNWLTDQNLHGMYGTNTLRHTFNT